MSQDTHVCLRYACAPMMHKINVSRCTGVPSARASLYVSLSLSIVSFLCVCIARTHSLSVSLSRTHTLRVRVCVRARTRVRVCAHARLSLSLPPSLPPSLHPLRSQTNTTIRAAHR